MWFILCWKLLLLTFSQMSLMECCKIMCPKNRHLRQVMAGPVCSVLWKVMRLCSSFCGSNPLSLFLFCIFLFFLRMLSMLKWKVSPYQICHMLPPTSSYRTFPFQGPNHLLSSRRHQLMGKWKNKLGGEVKKEHSYYWGGMRDRSRGDIV